MKIEYVYLDLDGVLVDWIGRVHEVLDLPYSYDTYKYPRGLWHWNHYGGPADKVIDSACIGSFWVGCKWMHDGKEILDAVQEITTPRLLTCPMPNPMSAYGKVLWVKREIPRLLHHLIITPLDKSFVAAPNALLIDDNDRNVNSFRDAGGRAILVPRPWNSDHLTADRSLEAVCERLRRERAA